MVYDFGQDRMAQIGEQARLALKRAFEFKGFG
jgi:hypothetical protein